MTRTAMTAFALALLIATGCAGPMTTSRTAKPFNVVEVGIPDLRQALAEGRVTSRQLVVEYLTRIAFEQATRRRIPPPATP